MISIDTPLILFTMDFDGDLDSGEAPVAGWNRFVELSFDRRDDFIAVVNFQGTALVRLKDDKQTLQRLRELINTKRVFIGNHSWDHPSFTGEYTNTQPLSRAEQADQLLRAEEFISSTLEPSIFFRAPFFDHNEETLQLISQLGIRYDLSSHISEDIFAPVAPYKHILPTYEILIRIDTNLKLSPLEWTEPLKTWAGESLKPGLYNIITHSREFSEPEQADEVIKHLDQLLQTNARFIGPAEIEEML